MICKALKTHQVETLELLQRQLFFKSPFSCKKNDPVTTYGSLYHIFTYI